MDESKFCDDARNRKRQIVGEGMKMLWSWSHSLPCQDKLILKYHS